MRPFCGMLEAVRERVARACQRAGRHVDEVMLIGVTKTFPVQVAAVAAEAGLRDLGENRVQELVRKAQALPDSRWHMIGHLQRNKARAVVEHADTFHALDSVRLAAMLNRCADEAGRVLPCFVQVNVSGEDSKYGFPPQEVEDALLRMADMENLRVQGFMTLAAPVQNPEEVRPQFRLLRAIRDRHLGRVPEAQLSMGMSGDFEVAIEEGATHIRLGTVLFGSRKE